MKAASAVPTMLIQPSRGWPGLGLAEVWEYRELLYFMLWRDVKGNYRQMALGPLWIILQPLVNMVIFSLVFGQLAKLPSDGVPYPIFTYVALLPWQFFASSLRTSAQSLVAQQHIISKVYFPRLVNPLAAVGSASADFAASFVILLAMMLFYGLALTPRMLLLPVFLLLAAMSALTVGLFLASLAVKYRDVSFGLGFAIASWQYLTPVAYSASLVPERWRAVYLLNPMANVVEGFRWALLGTGGPPGWRLAAVFAVVAALLVLSLAYFRHSERTIADLL